MTETAVATEVARFEHPDADYSPAAYWFWHHLPGDDEIRKQISEMLAGGYRSFQIQPRLAYPISEYLGPEYLAACRTAVQEAARLGMTVGVYDEYNWQSGQAGGRTVRGADHLRESMVFWATTQPGEDGIAHCAVDQITSSATDLGQAGLAWQYEAGRVAWSDWQIVSALAYPSGGVRAAGQIVDVAASARIVAASESGCAVDLHLDRSLADHAVTLFVAARCATSRLPNYLLAESARRFLEVGYQPYYGSFGEYFGSTVRYFFFDQPHSSYYDWPQRHGNLGSALPFASSLVMEFSRRTGRNFGHTLLALLCDIGPDTVPARCDFYQCFSQLMCENYLGTLADWCHRHDIALSGHEVLGHVGSWNPGRAFSGWDLRVNFGMDYFGVDSYRGITGVDAEDCVPQLSTKLGDSVARSNGRSGCIVEQYMAGRYVGGTPYTGDWGLSLSDLRSQAIRLQMLGARQFLFHGFYQTDGWDGDTSLFTNPRFDFPPGINFEPWWPFHRSFADEMARLSVFLDDAQPACDVALFYPLRTCWAEGPRHSYADHVEFWTSFLAEEGFGYHLIDERDLRAADVHGGRLRIREREYRCLVLPSVTTLQSQETMDAIRHFAEGGGLLVYSGDTPAHLQTGDTAFRETWSNFVELSPTAHYLGLVPHRQEALDLLGSLLGGHPHAQTPAGRDQVWQWAGQDASGWRLALFNDSSELAPVIISALAGDPEHQLWDARTGRIQPWAPADCGEPGTLKIQLPPLDLTLLRLRPAATRQSVARARHIVRASTEASQRPLAHGWSLLVPGRIDTPVPICVDRGWEQQGFPTHSGLGVYTCSFDRPDSRTWRLRLPAVSAAADVSLNGCRVGRRGWAPYEFELTGLRERDNELTITVFSTAANKYYSGTPFRAQPQPSGLLAAPVLIAN